MGLLASEVWRGVVCVRGWRVPPASPVPRHSAIPPARVPVPLSPSPLRPQCCLPSIGTGWRIARPVTGKAPPSDFVPRPPRPPPAQFYLAVVSPHVYRLGRKLRPGWPRAGLVAAALLSQPLHDGREGTRSIARNRFVAAADPACWRGSCRHEGLGGFTAAWVWGRCVPAAARGPAGSPTRTSRRWTRSAQAAR